MTDFDDSLDGLDFEDENVTDEMRLFVAIRFDDETIDALEAARDSLFAHAKAGTPCSRDNLHLTLAFIGEVDEAALFAIEDALDEVTNPLDMDLILSTVGRFAGRPSKNGKPSGDTWWVGIDDNPALAKLQRAIENRLRSIGLEFPDHAFKAHITIGRRVVLEKGVEAGELALLEEPIRAHVNAFSLMQTEFIDGKPHYEEICSWE